MFVRPRSALRAPRTIGWMTFSATGAPTLVTLPVNLE
jgi:hypothetical protein